MKPKNIKYIKAGFVSLIGLLLCILIIAVFYYLALKKTKTSNSGENYSNPRAVLDNAREKVNLINEKQAGRNKGL